jgi:putative flippase GtrA
MQKLLITIIDTFYPIFKRFMPLRTYRYAVCGGSNVVLDMVLYFVFYHYVLQKHNLDLGFMVMSAHIATLFIVFPITFLTGFLLNKYITFPDSKIDTKVQFRRYFAVSMGAILLSYVFMKLFVDGLGFYPTPSKLITIVISIIYSYTFQRKFSFKTD